MSLYYNKTRRNTVQRRAGRARYDRPTIDAILKEGIVAQVGVVADGQPYVIPVLYALGEREVFVHGSPLSRLLGTLREGVPMCLTVTLVDGIVLARSAFHHSLNYRSVVMLGTGRQVRDREEKLEALRLIVEHVVPGRSGDSRGPSEPELEATEVVAIEIDEASAKIRSGPPVDAAEDRDLPVWAGVIPLAMQADQPIPDKGCVAPLPAYLPAYRRAA